MATIGNKSWLTGDRKRQSNKGVKKIDKTAPSSKVSPVPDVTFIAYSGNTQPDWFDSRRPNPELKVTCFREKKDEITEEYYWDLLPERRRSFIENAE